MKILFAIALGFSLLAQTSVSHATSTSCKGEEGLDRIKTISWDDEALTAKVTDSLGRTHSGRVTLRRAHNDGFKVNILVTYEKPYFGSDATEYIVFPVSAVKYRVIAVNYLIRNGQRFLNTLANQDNATCAAL